MNVVRHDRCLAELGAEQLLELVGGSARDVWLENSDCATCELAQLGEMIEQAADGANSLLQGIGHPAAVHLATVHQPTSASRRRAVEVEARNGGMSRRGLFRRLIGEVTERVSSETGDEHLPRRRQRLLATLDKLSQPSDSPGDVVAGGFGEVVVDTDHCSACGLCAKFCPTGALAFNITTDGDGRERFDLRTRAARCVDCGVCTAACPESAISVETRTDIHALIDRSYKTVASGSLVACDACGAPVAGSPDVSKRCFGCRGGVVSPLRDEVGLMADLLARLPLEP